MKGFNESIDSAIRNLRIQFHLKLAKKLGLMISAKLDIEKNIDSYSDKELFRIIEKHAEKESKLWIRLNRFFFG